MDVWSFLSILRKFSPINEKSTARSCVFDDDNYHVFISRTKTTKKKNNAH
jgi:hypothetical protein